MKKNLFLIAAVFIINSAIASDDYNHFGVGVGVGMNYGGLGMNLTYAPLKFFAITGHAGYNLANANAGISANLYLNNRTKTYRPNIKVMYGYNAAIKVIGYSTSNTSYYGVTFGIGNEFRFGQKKQHGFDVNILFPIRSQKFKDDYDNLSISSNLLLWPVTFSFGYHFDF